MARGVGSGVKLPHLTSCVSVSKHQISHCSKKDTFAGHTKQFQEHFLPPRNFVMIPCKINQHNAWNRERTDESWLLLVLLSLTSSLAD